jgi:hypothetical protein
VALIGLGHRVEDFADRVTGLHPMAHRALAHNRVVASTALSVLRDEAGSLQIA